MSMHRHLLFHHQSNLHQDVHFFPYTTLFRSVSQSRYDHVTQTVTITADTTLKRLYDYSQYDLTLDANMPYSEWFTTIDGVNYTSTYNIVLNTGVDLTGGGTVDVGALTFTKTGTATYDGIIIHSANREVHIKLNDVVSGSTVQIYDTDNTTEILNDVYTSDVDYVYTWTTDTNIRVRIRKAGYIPYEATGTITETGFSLNIAQEVDSVYVANGIDGSTVTEFSLSEGVVGVFIDDPDNKTTNGSQISLRIAGKTDAGTTNGKLTWNYLYMNVRKYGYVFYHDQYNTIRTLLTPCMSVSTPSANPFITDSLS